MSGATLLSAIEALAGREPEHRAWVVGRRLTKAQQRTLKEYWPAWAHKGQLPPDAAWRVWLMLAGRGFGKTRAGAEWVSALARADGGLRIALVGASALEVARVMVLGETGLMAVAREDEDLLFYPSRGLVQFASGAQAFVYSGANPDGLRGPQHHYAWCDELAKWAYPRAAWNNLMLGLRLGEGARVVVTTTPRPISLLRELKTAPGTIATGGRTRDNVNAPPDFVADVTQRYGGTRLGRQELEGELFEDFEGALWTREVLEKCRAHAPEALARVVVGVDPPGSATGDACGIVVCGVGADGLGYVLGDHSVRGLSPEGWARAVAGAAEAWGADRVVVETNQGGEMVTSVLRSADVMLPVRPVRARFGKGRRAEPVSTLFASGKAKFAGVFPELEDELCGMTGNGYEGPGRSPDRADAMVWAMAELLLGGERGPRIRRL